MRYQFEMTLPFGEGLNRRALAVVGQNTFERALGGPDRVLLLALDLLTECCDYVDVFQQDFKSAAERRWGEAAILAHEAVLRAAGAGVAAFKTPGSEYLEHAFLQVTPACTPQYGPKGAWIDAYLTRLQELRLDAPELLSPAHGETAHGLQWQDHPIWCADELFVQVQASNEWPRRPHPVGQNPWFAQLRAELEGAIAAVEGRERSDALTLQEASAAKTTQACAPSDVQQP